MATLTIEQIDDLVLLTQKELGKMKWTDLTTDLQEYFAMPRILKKHKVKFDGGKLIQFNVMHDYNDTAKNVGLYQEDTVNVGDAFIQGSMPWRHCTTNYAYDRREVKINGSNKYKIIDMVKEKRAQALIALAALMEDNFWGKPADAHDKLKPHGLQYWITYNATEGFKGGNPSGFTDGCAGIDSTAYPRWKNWTAQYAAIDDNDFLQKLRKATRFSNFKPPVEMPNYQKADRYSYLTNWEVLNSLEKLLKVSNDNLGFDFGKYDGKASFLRRPIEWAPYLESDNGWDGPEDPLYGINWGAFEPFFLKGEYMVESKPQRAANQHTVSVVHVDCTLNYICRDRRQNFLLAKSATTA